MAEIELSLDQVRFGVYIQDMIDACGSCLVLGQKFRDTFKDNTDGLGWLCVHNGWTLKHDELLDLTRITGGSDSSAIRRLEERADEMNHRKEANS